MGIHPMTLVIFLILAGAGGAVTALTGQPLFAAVGGGLALLAVLSLRVARQWQKGVVLRLGRFHGLRGPGLFAIAPVLDTIPYWIDLRTITTPFTAEQTLTKDSVPVDVDAPLAAFEAVAERIPVFRVRAVG